MSFMSHEVSYRKKIEASFSEHLELHHFPLDRQLCRIKLIAESPIEEFQFVIRKKDKPHHPSRCIGTFEVAKDKSGEKIPAIAYVRYCDHECPFPKQRSMVNVLFHLDRKGDYYFNNILILVFLVSTCFLAVLSYRYIINEILPRKEYLTAADWYIMFACMFLILICLQTMAFAVWSRAGEDEQQHCIRYPWDLNTLEFYDYAIGIFMFSCWVAANLFLWCLWKLWKRQNWSSVYLENEEPWAPIQECEACGLQFLSSQCEHQKHDRINCSSCGSYVKRRYLTPEEHPEPLVPQEPLPPCS
ncbi:unnamed protein product [Durusdinium trenchii]|uniref:Protein S-acyltransferase n=1 Tax=Durusdinium trenchii TaxID=1381693 RepID=A0ABP0PWL9_9DINO